MCVLHRTSLEGPHTRIEKLSISPIVQCYFVTENADENIRVSKLGIPIIIFVHVAH